MKEETKGLSQEHLRTLRTIIPAHLHEQTHTGIALNKLRELLTQAITHHEERHNNQLQKLVKSLLDKLAKIPENSPPARVRNAIARISTTMQSNRKFQSKDELHEIATTDREKKLAALAAASETRLGWQIEKLKKEVHSLERDLRLAESHEEEGLRGQIEAKKLELGTLESQNAEERQKIIRDAYTR